ncbi:hypothetical protein BX666DRAFT_2027847 [Dichotomocladium elegans]|nr:hypothetical protein BX666DRAFT_2027847 [Dichotomocladium elegans]
MDNSNGQEDVDKIDDIAMATADGLLDDEAHFATYLRELQQDLTKEMQQSENRLPKCYESGTFWITPPSVFFTLRNKGDASSSAPNDIKVDATSNEGNSNNRSDPQGQEGEEAQQQQQQQQQQHQAALEQLLRRPRVFVWLVHLLVDNLECPNPECHGSKLQSHGWATAPCARRILDLSNDFYLMSYRYKCSRCKRTYFGHDKAIREMLPLVLQEEFPAILSHRSGVSRTTMELLQSCSNSSVGIGPFAKLLKEHQALRHARLKLQYLAAKDHPPSAPVPKPSVPRKRHHSSSGHNASYPSANSSAASSRPSQPPTIAPRPPQPTPVFLPHPMLAVHPAPSISAASNAASSTPIISVTSPSGTTHPSSTSSTPQGQPIIRAAPSAKQPTPIQPAPIQAAAPFPFFAIPPGGAIFYPAQQGMPIPFQPVFILSDPRAQQQPLQIQQQMMPFQQQQQPSFHVPKKPRKPRTILKKPT